MTKQKRSPWFNARTQPPVNGGKDARYEHRCRSLFHSRWHLPHIATAEWIDWWACPLCQWRGLLREDGGKA